jgi:uncharacterized protein
MTEIATDPILRRLRAALDNLYGDRIERVVLFGSRARGDAGEDSDYDVAVFLRDLGDRWQELDRLAGLRAEFLAEADVFIDAKPYSAGAYRNATTLMGEIRREGVDLCHPQSASISTRRGNARGGLGSSSMQASARMQDATRTSLHFMPRRR